MRSGPSRASPLTRTRGIVRRSWVSWFAPGATGLRRPANRRQRCCPETLQVARGPRIVGLATPGRLRGRPSGPRGSDILLDLHPRSTFGLVVPEVQVRSPADGMQVHTTPNLHGLSRMLRLFNYNDRIGECDARKGLAGERSCITGWSRLSRKGCRGGRVGSSWCSPSPQSSSRPGSWPGRFSSGPDEPVARDRELFVLESRARPEPDPARNSRRERNCGLDERVPCEQDPWDILERDPCAGRRGWRRNSFQGGFLHRDRRQRQPVRAGRLCALRVPLASLLLKSGTRSATWRLTTEE